MMEVRWREGYPVGGLFIKVETIHILFLKNILVGLTNVIGSSWECDYNLNCPRGPSP
jgi:hypothetical protein